MNGEEELNEFTDEDRRLWTKKQDSANLVKLITALGIVDISVRQILVSAILLKLREGQEAGNLIEDFVSI